MTCYSTDKRELWVSVIEKAYFCSPKACDPHASFPLLSPLFQNSGIDLYALTGWLPESVSLDPTAPDGAAADEVWARLLSAHIY